MESIWRKQSGEIVVQPVAVQEKYDVIVVGAGLTGLLTAYYLQEAGKRVLVLEADTVASGQTGRTTAKITSQHGLKYSDLIKKIGVEKARIYARANEAAIKEYEWLIKKEQIACQFEHATAYLYTQEDEKILIEEAKAAKFLGIDAFFVSQTKLPFQVKGAVGFRRQAQFSPLEFIKHIAGKLQILEHMRVLAVRGKRVYTEYHIFNADKIVVATHYPIRNVPGFYFLRQYQERSYALALADCEKVQDMYYSIDKEGLSIRQAGEFLLLGGGASRTGENKQGGAYAFLEHAAKEYFSEGKIVARWSAQDCMPHDGIPFIGRYSIFTPNLYVATGFQKWGMTTAMIAAITLRSEICGTLQPYAKLFSPQRVNICAAWSSLWTDIVISVRGLAKGFLHIPVEELQTLEPGHGGIITIEGKRFACYRDEKGELHTISARCPHMGCELAWNPEEKSWDCPCHGSRFDIEGKLLDNPAKKDGKKKHL